MPQAHVWEQEYKKPQLVTLGEDARKDLRECVKDLRRKRGVDIGTLRVLDLGCGTGRNAFFLAEHGAPIAGIDISPTAIDIAKKRAKDLNVAADFRVGNFGAHLPFADHSFDFIIDSMSSNSLSESERAVYLSEMFRTLAPGGYVFYRGLCKDGDTNAKNLIRLFPGPEYDTYVMPKMKLVERVFSEKDFRELYSPFFSILSLEKKSNYAQFDGKSYKRMYWIGLLQKL